MRRSLAVGAVAALALAACAGWDPSVRARERAIEVLHCEDVEMAQRNESQWHADGCGREADIACSTGSLEPTCIRVRLVGADDEHWAVPPVSPDDPVTSGSEAPLTDEALTAAAIADDTDLDPRADEGVTDDGPSSLVVPPVPPAVPSAPVSPAEASIRRGLDARRADVLACTGRTASVVRVRYDAQGALTISLAGDLEGSPEEGCVRAALSGVQVAPGESGTVLHLLRGAD